MAPRRTKQRDAIKSTFTDAAGPLSPMEVLEAAQDEVASLGIATVYRTLRMLEEEGYLTVVAIPGQPDRYELAGLRHHHHFCCRSCDRVFDIEGCPGRVRDLTPRGFAVEDHEVLLFGHCADCSG